MAARAEILPELPSFESKPLIDISNDSPSSAGCFASPLIVNKAKPKRNASATASAITAYVSPFPNSPDSSVVETPFDDKEKDPNWGPSRDDNEKDWANTPVGASSLGKRRSKLGIKNVRLFN
jgi:hypothetical protein